MRAMWQRVPLNWQRSPQVTDLADALRRQDPRILLIDLWEWAMTYGPVVTGDRAAKAIERGIGWRGKRGAFVAACVETGWIEQDGDTYRIRDWAEVLSIDWSTASVRNEDIDESPEERRKRLDRERKRRARQAARGAEPEDNGAEMSASRPHDVRSVSASCPHHVRTMSASCPACVRIVSASEADKKRTNARADQDQDQDQDLDSKNPPPPPAGGQGTLPVAVQTSPPAQPKRARAKRKATDDAIEASITRILTHWRERAEMPRAAIEGPGSEKRRSRIRQRLAEGMTEEDLLRVADGMALDDWLMGRDPNCTRPGGYRDVQTVYRDRPQCERLILAATGPPPGPIGINEMHRRIEASNPQPVEDDGPAPWDIVEEAYA